MTRRKLLTAAAVFPGARAAIDGKLKITGVAASPLQIREGPVAARTQLSDFDYRRWRAFGPFSQLNGAILVRIQTDAGITGYGIGGGGGAACYIIENHLRDLLLGVNPLNVGLIGEQLFASTAFYGRRGVAVQAISGIDLALWDITGKHANAPVYRLVGGPTRDRVPGYYTGNDVEHGLKLGFVGVKISNFATAQEGREGMRANVEKILHARRRIGPEPLLMADALCAWDVSYTLELAQRVAEARLHFLEEPLMPDDIAGYTRLCTEVPGTRIASGEHEATLNGFAVLLRERAAHILQPDVTWSGGLTECRRVSMAAEAAGVPVVPHRGSSVYGMTLIATCQVQTMAESFGTGDSGNELMELLTPTLENGHYLLPRGPGFGVDFTSGVLKKFAPGLV